MNLQSSLVMQVTGKGGAGWMTEQMEEKSINYEEDRGQLMNEPAILACNAGHWEGWGRMTAGPDGGGQPFFDLNVDKALKL